MPVLTQHCKLIPSRLTASLAKMPGIDIQGSNFPRGAMFVRLLIAQPTHAIGLNDASTRLLMIQIAPPHTPEILLPLREL